MTAVIGALMIFTVMTLAVALGTSKMADKTFTSMLPSSALYSAVVLGGGTIALYGTYLIWLAFQ